MNTIKRNLVLLLSNKLHFSRSNFSVLDLKELRLSDSKIVMQKTLHNIATEYSTDTVRHTRFTLDPSNGLELLMISNKIERANPCFHGSR